MELCFVICVLSGIGVFLSVLLKPEFTVGKLRLGTYWLIPLFGALLLICTGGVPLSYIGRGLIADSSVNPLKILLLFFSMTFLSVYLDEVGFFRYLASVALRRAGRSQTVLFVTLYLTVSVLTVFTSNDIVILTFTPFICFFARHAKIDPLPYLISEFVAANTWSLLFLIGNPTNIYLASSAGIGFLPYLAVMALPTVFAGLTSFAVLWLLFRRKLRTPLVGGETTSPEPIADAHELELGVFHLAGATLLLAVSSYLHLEMVWVAVGFALSLAVMTVLLFLHRHSRPSILLSAVRRLPFSLIPFVLSMFVLVLGMNYSGLTDRLAALLITDHPIFRIGISSFFAANLINNIPMSVLFSSILQTVAGDPEVYRAGIFAAVIGSNIGAYLTPVGALAGIMWSSILRRFGVRFSFRKFILYGAAVSLPTLLAALAGLWIVL